MTDASPGGGASSAPDAFTDGLIAAMRANSSTGEFSGSSYRPYLEKYNTERGTFRGASNLVLPNTPVRFVDAEATEQWLADNSMKYLGFDLVAAIFGEMSPLSRIVYTLVGASALWQLIPLFRGDEARRAHA